MASEWRDVSLDDVVEIKHGFAFQGEFFRDDPPGDVLLTPGNFAIGGGFKDDKLKYYTGPTSAEFVLAAGDLLVTMTDLSKAADTLGYPAFVPPSGGVDRYLHNQRLGKVVVKPGAPLEKRFLYYVLCGREYRNEVIASATGTTVKHTSPSRIGQFRFKLPDVAEQQAIAHVLGTMDDKIELNRRMNATLEGIAQALFSSLFVDFDPVRAKAESRDPGLPGPLADLFPDSFDTCNVPSGWARTRFSDTVEIIGGGTPKTSVAEYWNGDIPWFSVADAPHKTDVWVIETEKKITQAGVDNSSTKILPERTTIISARGTVGRVALVGVPMAMNQSCYGLRGLSGKKGSFTYFSTRQLVSLLQQRAHGSVFDTITRESFAGVNVPLPPEALIAAFEEMVESTLERIRTGLFESRALAHLRDALLPKLISGELRLPGVERIVGGQV